MTKLVNGLKTTVSGSTVQTSWNVSTDDVWTVIEKVAKKIEEHIKNAKAGNADGKGGDAFN